MTREQIKNIKEGYYIGFDQALSNTGWAIGYLDSSNELSITDFGVYELKKKKKGKVYSEQERLLLIEDKVKELIWSYKPNMCFTESVFLEKSNPNRGKVLIKVEATIHNILANNAIEYEIVNSSSKTKNSWRYQLDIPRKDRGKNESVRRLKLSNLREHSADAVAIMLTGLINQGLVDKQYILNEYVQPESSKAAS